MARCSMGTGRRYIRSAWHGSVKLDLFGETHLLLAGNLGGQVLIHNDAAPHAGHAENAHIVRFYDDDDL